MTEKNPYRPPHISRSDTDGTVTETPGSQRSWLGAVLLGLLGYIGPILIIPLADHVVHHDVMISNVPKWMIGLHWPHNFAEYFLLSPSLFCLIVFASAGYLGFPKMLLRDPARSYLLAGTFALSLEITYWIIVSSQDVFFSPILLNSAIYCGLTVLPSLVMLVILVSRRKVKAPNDV